MSLVNLHSLVGKYANRDKSYNMPTDKNTIRDNLGKYQNSCERSKNAQSTTFSTISRSLIYAIIATDWVLLYVGEKTQIDNLNKCLIWSAILSFVYVILDVIHYFVDTCRYFCLSKKLYDTSLDMKSRVKTGDSKMKNISSCSFYAIIGKLIISTTTSIVFLIGLISKVI